MLFVLKFFISAFIISFASWLAGRKPILAGFIVALPFISILSIFFAYLEHRDMNKINQFATSILFAVPLSLVFFLPFLLNKWLKLNFALTFISGIFLIAITYAISLSVFKSGS